MSRPRLSIVIPCYNEEKRLEPTLSQSLAAVRKSFSRPFEVIFVDDGSTDGTKDILQAAGRAFHPLPIVTLSYAPNRGKGYAVRTGVLAARGDKVVVMDADFSIELEETSRFLEKLDQVEVAIGTKKHAQTQSLRRQNFTRRFLGKGFTVLTDWLLGLRYTDITCGLKGFQAAAGKDIFRRQRLERWSYDAESLFLARRLGYRVVEIPIRWHHVEGSKVSTALDVARSFRDLLLIRFNALIGRYSRPPS
jgi:dolichyl-phosphate beta-glucosyltransferase